VLKVRTWVPLATMRARAAAFLAVYSASICWLARAAAARIASWMSAGSPSNSVRFM